MIHTWYTPGVKIANGEGEATCGWRYGTIPDMQPLVVELFKKAADLPEEDRATLAGLLIESLDTETEEGVEQAWQEEVQRRLSELDSGSVKTVPWESVRARILKRPHDSQS